MLVTAMEVMISDPLFVTVVELVIMMNYKSSKETSIKPIYNSVDESLSGMSKYMDKSIQDE